MDTVRPTDTVPASGRMPASNFRFRFSYTGPHLSVCGAPIIRAARSSTEDTGLDVEQNTVLYGLEGAGIWLDEPIYVRGSGVLGAARISREVAGGPSIVETSFMLGGGITFGKRLGHFFFGVEPSFPLVIGSDLTGPGFVLYFTAGYITGS